MEHNNEEQINDISTKEVREKDIVRAFLFQPKQKINESDDLTNLSCIRIVLALKTGRQNPNQVMPIGGGKKAHETKRQAIERECIEETHTRPIDGFDQIGKQRYSFFHRIHNVLQVNKVTYYQGDILPTDQPYVLNPSEDKMKFAYLTYSEFKDLVMTQKLPSVYADVSIQDIYIVDSLNLDEQTRRERNVNTYQGSVLNICDKILHIFEIKEMSFKKYLCIAVAQLLQLDDRISAEEYDDLESSFNKTNSLPEINKKFISFLEKYSIDHTLLQRALEYVNYRIEVNSLGDNEQASWKRAPHLLQS